MQSYVDSIAKYFGVFRDILSSFPFPILDFFSLIVYLLLGFAVAKIIINAL